MGIKTSGALSAQWEAFSWRARRTAKEKFPSVSRTEALQSFFLSRPAWHEEMEAGIIRIDLPRRGTRCRGCRHPRAGNTAFRVFANHETRDTKHGLYTWLFGSLWVGKSRTARNRRRTAAHSDKSRLPYPPFPTKNIVHEPVSVHRQPFSVGLETSAVSSQMTPCRERRTFWITPTGALSILR